jgi:hypothetical protein
MNRTRVLELGPDVAFDKIESQLLQMALGFPSPSNQRTPGVLDGTLL